jgi:hypothetical protein
MNNKIAFYHESDPNVMNDNLIDNYDDTNEYVNFTNKLRDLSCQVHTLDVFQKQKMSPDICIFLDIPKKSINIIINTKVTKSVVLLREADMISNMNYDKKRHNKFDLILTWKNNLIDNKKYFFYPSTRFVYKNKVKVQNLLDRKLCTLINSNLSSNIEGELYSYRVKAIEWFEKNYLDDFDLWGYGWDKYRVQLRGRTLFKSKLFAKKRISYKGMAQDKLITLSQYKFSICFENTSTISDYITEKIFDSFLAQNIPIYWGATNIEDIIPKECFIDFREFRSYDKLYSFIKNMDDKTYMSYIDAINTFLNSKEAYKYSIDNWVEVVQNAIFRLDS